MLNKQRLDKMAQMPIEYYKPVFDYNTSIQQILHPICAPLERHFGITHFAYFKHFSQGHYICLSNSSAYQTTTLLNDYMMRTSFFSNLQEALKKHKINKVIWPDVYKTDDDLVLSLHAQGIAQGLNLSYFKEETVEMYFFGASPEHIKLQDLYKRHAFYLEKFCLFFQEKVSFLLRDIDKRKMGISPHLRAHYPIIDSFFCPESSWDTKGKEFLASLRGAPSCQKQSILLSPREKECLLLLSKARSTKEIARLLNISPRTVESYLDNIRYKTGYRYKADLVRWFESTLPRTYSPENWGPNSPATFIFGYPSFTSGWT